MTYDIDNSIRNLEELLAWYTPRVGQRNEATTRLHLIDSLFFNCLGWPKDDVTLEDHHNGEYADYIFKAPRSILIVEAKKEGEHFEIPVDKDSLEYSIQTIIRSNPNLKEALEQVARYCQSRGVPLGAISNGHQIVAFIATRNDGISPLDGKAIVFPSLEYMLTQFTQLWNALSKEGIEQKKLHSRLIGKILPHIPPKLSSSISEYPGTIGRNNFQTDLQIVSELVFEDITQARDLEKPFLEQCYCKSGALSQHSLTSKIILQARYSALYKFNDQTVVPVADKQGLSPKIIEESFSRRPILLIGDVGVGKTIFIRNLINIEAHEEFENAITLYIDLGSQAALSNDLIKFIPNEISNQLRDNYEVDVEERNFVRGVYNVELQRFRKGIHSDLYDIDINKYRVKEIEFLEGKLNNLEEHLKHSVQHISKGRQQQIVIFLDNTDQREEEIQQQAFLIAQELADRWTAAVFVALRPETYYRSRDYGVLSGYHPKAFTISPPRIDEVINKRLQFSLNITSGDMQIKSLVQDIGVRLESLDKIIRIFIDSLSYNDELLMLIDNISGGNVRVALDLVKGFFGSGHVDTQKIVDTYDVSGSYYIPVHEFLRAVIFGDSEYYDPFASPIANLFDVSQYDPKEHFLLPLIIGELDSLGRSHSKEGFVETTNIYEHMQALRYTPEQIDRAIVRGFRKKLIDTATNLIREPGQELPSALRPTSVGLYHINRLCRLFTYFDAVIVDTPIFDPTVRESIYNVRNIEPRLDRVETFCKYLDEQWGDFNNIETRFSWPSCSVDLKINVNLIRGIIEKKHRN